MTKSDDTQNSTAGISQQMAETAIDLFVEKLVHHAAEAPDQKLQPQDIAAFAQDFKEQQFKVIAVPTQTLLNDWLNKHQADLKNQNRRQPFERIIVERFAALFPPGETLDSDLGISRRVLPGLFRQFEILGGAQLLDQCHGAALRIFDQVRKEHGADFRYKHYYQNAEANLLVDELMIVMAWRFQNFEKQFQTFVSDINDHLAPPDTYAYEGKGIEQWTLTKDRALAILWMMFEPYTHKLRNPDEKAFITKQFGAKAEQALEDVLRNIQDRLG